MLITKKIEPVHFLATDAARATACGLEAMGYPGRRFSFHLDLVTCRDCRHEAILVAHGVFASCCGVRFES